MLFDNYKKNEDKMLDCQTPKGKLSIDKQEQTQKVIERLGRIFVRTGSDDSRIDGIICDMTGRATGVAEIKCREYAGDEPLTVDYLKRNGGYLITNSKITYGSSASFLFGVPFFIIVNLVLDNKILIWQITDNKGELIVAPEIKKTETRKTINGGTAVRDNAFLPMDKCKILESN